LEYIVLSVLFNTVLLVIFKFFNKYDIDVFTALVANYITAFLVGFSLNYHSISIEETISKPWIFGSFLLGFLFISVFYITAITSQRNGLSVASVSSKMSVIIPIIFGVILYQDKMGLFKIIGIILALFAVYLTTKKNKAEENKGTLLFPILLFFGAGCIDTSIKLFQNNYVAATDISLFSTFTFLMAFTAGIIIIITRFFFNPVKIIGKNILAGIILGIPNYFSLYYMVKMLDSKVLESSTIFTIHNVSIVIISTLLGVFFYNESINKRNILGILIAIIAIVLVTI
jgi:drug/metabolite transporter (DMT)-like permease